jgi:hypothetical protein
MPEPEALSNEGWFNNRWRPAMAWLWFTVSACDFILFPILNALAAGAKMIPYLSWQPLTLQGGGLFHMAMGAVVGVATWQRTQEKLAIMRSDSGSYSESSHTIETVTSKDAGKPVVEPISSRAD